MVTLWNYLSKDTDKFVQEIIKIYDKGGDLTWTKKFDPVSIGHSAKIGGSKKVLIFYKGTEGGIPIALRIERLSSANKTREIRIVLDTRFSVLFPGTRGFIDATPIKFPESEWNKTAPSSEFIFKGKPDRILEFESLRLPIPTPININRWHHLVACILLQYIKDMTLLRLQMLHGEVSRDVYENTIGKNAPLDDIEELLLRITDVVRRGTNLRKTTKKVKEILREYFNNIPRVTSEKEIPWNSNMAKRLVEDLREAILDYGEFIEEW